MSCSERSPGCEKTHLYHQVLEHHRMPKTVVVNKWVFVSRCKPVNGRPVKLTQPVSVTCPPLVGTTDPGPMYFLWYEGPS